MLFLAWIAVLFWSIRTVVAVVFTFLKSSRGAILKSLNGRLGTGGVFEFDRLSLLSTGGGAKPGVYRKPYLTLTVADLTRLKLCNVSLNRSQSVYLLLSSTRILNCDRSRVALYFLIYYLGALSCPPTLFFIYSIACCSIIVCK
jgi:hypothetical protein